MMNLKRLAINANRNRENQPPRIRCRAPVTATGFTLVEMIVVIVLTGIIGSVVAVFLRLPVQGYADSARRAEISDIADTALRRVSRDLRSALPNSVRVTGTCGGANTCYIEFIPVIGGGRYRNGLDATDDVCPGATTDDDKLDFGAVDTCFEVLGTMPTAAAGDYVVVYNMGDGEPDADAYTGFTAASDNRRLIGAVGVNNITLTSVNPLPKTSCVWEGGVVVGGCRFHVVQTAVSYVCDGAGNLLRWQGYTIQAAQPVVMPGTGTVTKLATNVSDCRFIYDVGVAANEGLVTMHLGITEQDQSGNSETVSMYAATHVNNVP